MMKKLLSSLIVISITMSINLQVLAADKADKRTAIQPEIASLKTTGTEINVSVPTNIVFYVQYNIVLYDKGISKIKFINYEIKTNISEFTGADILRSCLDIISKS